MAVSDRTRYNPPKKRIGKVRRFFYSQPTVMPGIRQLLVGRLVILQPVSGFFRPFDESIFFFHMESVVGATDISHQFNQSLLKTLDFTMSRKPRVCHFCRQIP